MTDADLFALCVWDEASGEPYEGKVAVARVVLNRMAARYESDGTIIGTVLKKFQFSGFWFAMEGGRYSEIEWDVTGAQVEASRLLVQAKTNPALWGACQKATTDAVTGSSFVGGPAWAALKAQPRTLMYANLDICDPAPAWATSDRFVTRIFHHSFYRI
jgi:hypothetical protein